MGTREDHQKGVLSDGVFEEKVTEKSIIILCTLKAWNLDADKVVELSSSTTCLPILGLFWKIPQPPPLPDQRLTLRLSIVLDLILEVIVCAVLFVNGAHQGCLPFVFVSSPTQKQIWTDSFTKPSVSAWNSAPPSWHLTDSRVWGNVYIPHFRLMNVAGIWWCWTLQN